MKKIANTIDNYFKITTRQSTVTKEIRGGFATFFAMSYIVVLNPLILGLITDSAGNTLGVTKIAAATALVAGVLTIIMGIVANYPFALAAGLGVNVLVSVTVATNPQLSWPDMMGIVFISGIIMLILVLTGFRQAVFKAVPENLKTAIVVGIGLFIALIGLVNAGFVRRIPDAAQTTVPLGLGSGGELRGWPTLVFLFGLFLTIALVVRKTKGAILIGIISSTIFAIIVEVFSNTEFAQNSAEGWSLVAPKVPTEIFSLPDLSLIGSFSLLGAFTSLGYITATLLVFVILLSIFFDAMGTTLGLATEADLLDKKGNIPNIDKVLVVDSFGAIAGGSASVSSNQIFVESAAGVGEGARTGLANVVTGLLFLLAMFFTPLVQVVPFEAVAPALVVVGFMMVSQIRFIDWSEVSLAIPAFFTFTLMPFTYSIANGLGAGFVAFVFIKVVQGKFKQIHPVMWLVAFAFVVYFSMAIIKIVLV